MDLDCGKVSFNSDDIFEYFVQYRNVGEYPWMKEYYLTEKGKILAKLIQEYRPRQVAVLHANDL